MASVWRVMLQFHCNGPPGDNLEMVAAQFLFQFVDMKE